MREDFTEHALLDAYDIDTNQEGEYKSTATRIAFRGYQMRQSEIDALNARNAGLQELLDLREGTLDSRNRNIEEMIQVNRDLMAENERLKADAERINALEQKGLEIRIQFNREEEDIFLVYKIRGFPNDLEFIEIGCGVTVREAIDAAMKDST